MQLRATKNIFAKTKEMVLAYMQDIGNDNIKMPRALILSLEQSRQEKQNWNWIVGRQ